MKQGTIQLELSKEDVDELERFWDDWNDESFALHAAYIFRKLLIKAGYMKEYGCNSNL